MDTPLESLKNLNKILQNLQSSVPELQRLSKTLVDSVPDGEAKDLMKEFMEKQKKAGGNLDAKTLMAQAEEFKQKMEKFKDAS